MGCLEQACENQTEEQRHITSPKLVLKGELSKAVQFVCDREKGGVLQPEKLAEDRTDNINKTATSVLKGKHQCEKIPSYSTLETYEETHIFIPIDLTEEAVESVAHKILGGSGSGGTDSEGL